MGSVGGWVFVVDVTRGGSGNGCGVTPFPFPRLHRVKFTPQKKSMTFPLIFVGKGLYPL